MRWRPEIVANSFQRGHGVDSQGPVYTGIGAVAHAEENAQQREGKTAGGDDEGERGQGHTDGRYANDGGAPDAIRVDTECERAEDGSYQCQDCYTCRCLYKVGHVCDVGKVVLDEGHE